MLYFAYGSNMHIPSLKDWMARRGVPETSVRGEKRAFLHVYRLRTNIFSTTHQAGACNIEPRKGNYVEGIIFEVSERARAMLRRKEGWPTFYDEIEVVPYLPTSGIEVTATTFIVPSGRCLSRNQPVSAAYRDLVLKGAQYAELSRDYQKYLGRLLRPISLSESDSNSSLESPIGQRCGGF